MLRENLAPIDTNSSSVYIPVSHSAFGMAQSHTLKVDWIMSEMFSCKSIFLLAYTVLTISAYCSL